MSRVVGFSLKLEGSSKTISDIEKVEKALKGITDQINSSKKINVGVLKPLFEGQEQFRKALKETNKALKEQSDLLVGLGNSKTVDKTVLDALLKQVNNLKLEINKLQQELNNLKSPSVSVPNPEGFEKIRQETKKTIDDVKKLAPALEGLLGIASQGFANKIVDIDTKLKLVKDNILKFKGQGGESNTEDIAQLLAAEKALTAEKAALTKQLNEEARAHTSVAKAIDSTSVIGLRAELAKLKKEYLNLSEAERESARGQEIFNKSVALNSKLSGIEQSFGDFSRNVGNYRDAVSGLLPQLEKLQQAGIISQKSLIGTFQSENKAKVASLTAEVNKLATALDKMTKEEREAAQGVAAFAQLETKIKELNSTVVSTSSGFDRFGKSALGIGNVITGGLIGGGFVAAFQTAFQGIKKAINVGAELSDIESDVRKTTGLTIQEVQRLETAFKKIDTRTSTSELLKISAVAGQLGVTGVKGIEEFTKAINIISVALGDDLGGGVDKISNDLSKLSNILYGSTTDGEELAKNIGFIGNALNVLASTSAATGDKIVDFASRIGRSLSPLGLGADQILALSATFDELNILPEQGATAINNLIKDIGANINLFSETLQISKDELKVAFDTNPLNTFFIVLNKINELSGGSQSNTLSLLKDLKQTGEGVSSVFLQMGKNTDIYNRNLGNSTTALKTTSSLTNEYEIKNQNLAGTLDKLSKKFQDLSTNQGFLSFIDKAGKAVLGLGDILGKATITLSLLGKTIRNQFTEGYFNKIFGDIKTVFSGTLSVGETITKQFGKTLATKIDLTKFKQIDDELADRLLDIKYNNIQLEKEIQESNKKIEAANFVLINTSNEAKINEQKAIIKTQQDLIKENKSKIVNEKSFAANFVTNTAFPVDDETVKKTKEVEKAKTAEEIAAAAERKRLTKEELEKRKKAYEDYLRQIKEIKRRIEELRVGAIEDEFEKRRETIKDSTKYEIEDAKIKYSRVKGLRDKLISSLKENEKNQLFLIDKDQAKAIEDARNELEKLKKEIDGIVNNTVEINIQTNISNAKFDLEQENRTIELTYDGNIEPLKKALAEGKISQKQFDKDVYELDKDRLDKQLIAATSFKKITDDLYDALYNTQLQQLKIDNERIKSGIILKGQQEQQLAFENRKTGKSNINPINEAITIASKTNAELLEQEGKFNDAKNKLDKDHTKNVQDTENKVNEIRKAGAEKTTENTKGTNEEIKAAREALEKSLLDLAINSAKEISDAIFEIEKSQQDRILEQQLSSLEKSRDARLKMVKGNAVEEERINAEFNDKKNKLERDAFERGKKLSIQQAIISGSLAALNALATVKPFPLAVIAALGTAVQTAIQIAKIRATSFAEGGLIKKLNSRAEGGRTGGSNAPPDHTGERPVGTATIHEGEYITPRWQVDANKELIEAMDKDRLLKTNHHSKKYLQKQILQAIEAREKSNTGLFRKREPIQTPVFYQASYFKNQGSDKSVSISQESMHEFADIVAKKTELAIAKGTNEGYTESTKAIIKDELRQFNFKLKQAQ